MSVESAIRAANGTPDTSVGNGSALENNGFTVRAYWLPGLTREEVEIEREEPLQRQLAAFIECASTGRAPKVSGFQATAALELAVEITRRIISVPRG